MPLLTSVFTLRAPRSLNEAREGALLAYFRELPEDRQEDVLRMIRALQGGHAKKGNRAA